MTQSMRYGVFLHGFQHAVEPLSSRLHDRMIQTTHSSVIFEAQSSKNSMKNLFICIYIYVRALRDFFAFVCIFDPNYNDRDN